MADMSVVETAFRVLHTMGASPKVALALFEAALVESDFRNLNYGADDSRGYLQQRPSQGWPDVMNVETATRSFVTRAKANEAKNPGYTAGQLAQSVQRSLYPDKYDKRETDARKLLGDRITQALPEAPDADLGLVDAVGAAAGALKGMVSGVTNIGALATQIGKLAIPSNVVRLVTGILGIVLIFFGITILGRQVKNG